MVIVSQNKKQIIIFENMNTIETFSSGDKFSLRAENRDDVYVLGTYKTEERAMEVLQEIIKLYSWFETIKITPDSCKVTMLEQLQKNGYEKMSIYEMPKE